VLGVLGAGASGHVYSGTWRGAPVAVKQLGGSVLKTSEWGSGVSTQGRKRLLSVNEKTNAGPASEAARTAMLAMVRRLVKEAAILSTLRHPNIVCLYGLVVDSRHHALITEIVPGMNLCVQRGCVCRGCGIDPMVVVLQNACLQLIALHVVSGSHCCTRRLAR